MEKGDFLKSKRLVKNTTILMVWFVVIVLISSSTLSANLNNNLKANNSNLSIIEEEKPVVVETSAGLAPIIDVKNSNLQTNSVVSLEETMYGYIANSPTFDEGPCIFPLDDPGSIDLLQETVSDDFLSGGTGSIGEWWACENSNGALWEIDPETGDMTSIGGGGVGLNGLAWDPMYSRLYGATGSSLYEIDPETGEQEFIGSFGHGIDEMIGVSVDLDGNMYGWDLGFDKLWEIDIDTGEAYEIGSLGIDINYAQDGAIDWDTNMLWLSAYTISPNYGSYLYYWDWDAEECVLIGQIEDNSQITASAVSLGWYCCEHDVGVKSIDMESGYAIENIPMEATVKNYGPTPETFDVQMEVSGNQTGSLLLEEGFSGSFPPEGWETDGWTQCNSSCCQESPCACLYHYNQSQNYSNYIISKPVDASQNSSCTLNYYLCADMYYGQYCSLYVKIRKNETSPWKDVTPWDNPFGGDIEGDYYQIDIHSFNNSEGCGEALRIKWEFIGYYYYYNNVCLDTVSLVANDVYYEYAELVEDITLDPGESKQVEFPSWTPSHWQDPEYEDTWVDYIVHVFTLLDGDQFPRNDYKYKYINLYFPWMHDIEITSIDSPFGDGPGKTYPVEATITNVGQYAECCIPINMSIGEPVVLDTLLDENSWDTVPPEGWYDEHKDFSEDYGWKLSNTSYSGGESPEARLYYYQARANYVFYSYAIDTSDYSNCRFEFKSYIHHYSGEGLYALEAGYSYDGENWNAAWHEEPSSSGNYEVSVKIEGGHETTYIGFWVTGNPYYFNYWYIDDVSVKVLDYVSEYSDFACQGDYLEPGESITFDFDDWTPDYLQYETTGSKDYIVYAEINMAGDKNPDNDIKSIDFTLDYWHDPALEKVTSPEGIIWPGDLCWDNGEPDGRNALFGSMYQGYSNIIIDDFENEEDWIVTDGHFSFVWDSGYEEGNLETVRVYFFKDQGDCDPFIDEYAMLEVIEFTEYTTGNYYFGRPEIAVDVEFDEVELPSGKWWIGFQPDGKEEDKAYLLTAEGYGCEVMADLPYWGYPRWASSSYLWGTEYDLSWKLTCNCPCVQPLNAYIQPGTESIDAIAINYGTFEELDLTCNAQIWDYIFDPENGTKLYEENITNIDLDEPLGGTYNLEFDDFNFEYEGRYGLYLEMSAPNDDKPKNNKIRWGIGVDATNPISDYTLDPPTPDGANGWYVEDVEVSLYAYDPVKKDVSSGVAEIKYMVNGGPIETITGCDGYFYLTYEDDGEDVLVEFWAIDNVGNEETPHNKFTIDMDQTDPDLDLSYEITGGNPIQGWTVLCTATATDETSGMERVEFFLNYYFQDLVEGSGPTFEWEFVYHGDLNLVVTAWGFDIAGNMASDEIDPVKSASFNQNIQNQKQSTQKLNFLHMSQQNIFNISGGGYE